MGIDAVRPICDALAREPLFHLSLHSKELFHSNFLGWFCDTHPGAAAEAFRTWVPADPASTVRRVQRERDQLDLAVELPGLAPFVVENKVFAPPDDAQLDGYAEGKLAGLKLPTLLLLSLGRPMWESGTYVSKATGAVWRYVSYRELADALDAVRPSVRGFERELVEHYCSFVRHLHELVAVSGGVAGNEPIAVDDETYRLLREMRLHDAVGKLRARVAIAAARAFTIAHLPDSRIRWEALFSNATPLVAAFWNRRDGDWLGWQYQGGQWRVVVITEQHKGSDSALRARRHAYVAERYSDWFDFEAITELTGRPIDVVPPTESKGQYLGFNPDFVYRYRAMPGLTRAELVSLSHHYLTAAAHWP